MDSLDPRRLPDAAPNDLPLSGVTVIDFTRVVSGPFGTLLLSLMGANVIKIEHPEGGDEARGFCGNSEMTDKGVGSTFLSLNVGKRSVAVDLKLQENQVLMRELIRDADVVVENFRPGVMERLNLSYEHLRVDNPGLIYCAISGYGQTGPDAHSAGYDGAIQAASGLMSITGFPDGPPTRVGIPIGDIVSGYSAAFAVVSALRKKERTGSGQFIDVSMFESILFAMRNAVAWWNVGGNEPERLGNMAWTKIPASDVFPVHGEHLMITVNTEPQFRRLCVALGLESLLSEEQFADMTARKCHAAELRSAIVEALKAASAKDWEGRLKEAGIAAAVVNTVRKALDHPQLAHRNVFMHIGAGGAFGEPLELLNLPFKVPGLEFGTDLPPPALGQHTDEVLGRYRKKRA